MNDIWPKRVTWGVAKKNRSDIQEVDARSTVKSCLNNNNILLPAMWTGSDMEAAMSSGQSSNYVPLGVMEEHGTTNAAPIIFCILFANSYYQEVLTIAVELLGTSKSWCIQSWSFAAIRIWNVCTFINDNHIHKKYKLFIFEKELTPKMMLMFVVCESYIK